MTNRGTDQQRTNRGTFLLLAILKLNNIYNEKNNRSKVEDETTKKAE